MNSGPGANQLGRAPRLKIGVSVCFMHADPQRALFTGKTLQYVEQSLIHWIQAPGALTVAIPAPAGGTQHGDIALEDYADLLDGLVLEGGADMWPGSYGQTALRPEWNGDRVRDEYEIALLRAFVARGKPVLGVCRGLQVINVAYGGTLYQDLTTQMPGAGAHRVAELYDRNEHEIDFVAGTRLARLYPGFARARVNSVHHQGIQDLAPEFVVEARSAGDSVIEALRWTGASYLAGVQWHPEFHDHSRNDLLDGGPLLADFLAACGAVRGAIQSN